MTTISEKLLQHGIRLSGYGDGSSHKITCPKCSATRRDKTDAGGDGAVWQCHHCGWADNITPRERAPEAHRRSRREPPTKPSRKPGEATTATFDWFAARGIGAATVRRNRVGFERTWLP